MLKKAGISHKTETEKLDVDKRLKEICEIKKTLLKIQQDVQDAIKTEGNTMLVNEIAKNQHTIIENQKVIYNCMKSRKHSDKYIFYTLRFDCSFAAANTIKPQLL